MERVFLKLEQMGIAPIGPSDEPVDRTLQDGVMVELKRRATVLRAEWESEEAEALATAT